jgi:hypothetical protein
MSRPHDPEFKARLATALQLLEQRGVSTFWLRFSLFRLLWALGIPIPPPHFNTFAFNLCFMLLWLALVMGLYLWFMMGRILGTFDGTITAMMIAGWLLGAVMYAVEYRKRARRYNLPRWPEIQTKTEIAEIFE